MSNSYPPAGPPAGPPFGPPNGPPNGPPEYLDPAGGAPVPPSGPQRSGGGGRKAVVAGGAIAGLAAVAVGGYFAWGAFFGSSGEQASAGLPASTLGYVSVDLDPSGQQKVEALEMLEKFPGFAEAADAEGIDADTDLRAALFEQIQEEGACPDLSFADDVEPWLGTTFAFAAVRLDGEAEGGGPNVAPVAVVEVADAAAAEDGVEALRSCSGGSEEDGGIVIEGDWAVIAETQEQADEVSAAAQEAPLSDDEDHQRWMDAVGDPGVMTGYASPATGDLIAEVAELAPMMEDASGMGGMAALQQQVTSLVEDFDGAAMSVRFEDGGLEVETASSTDFMGLGSLTSSDRGDDVVATLPEDTAVAIGLGFEEGWFTDLTDYAQQFGGDELQIEESLAFLEGQTGLAFPEDIETLLGESAALAVSGDLDPAAVQSNPTALPAGLKIQGDGPAITGVIDQLLGGLPPEAQQLVGYQSDDDFVTVGVSEEYATELLEDGGLGDSDAYQDVVRESGDASTVMFVNFDAGDWLTRATAFDPEVQANVEPLDAMGISAWTDDDVSHSVFRITTDD